MLTGPLIFSGAVGGGADWERAPSVDAGCPRVFFFFFILRGAPGQSHHRPSVPLKATGLLHSKLAMSHGCYFHSPL